MEDLLAILTKRIRDKNPALTPQELEKEIAHCVGTKINDLIKQTIIDKPIELLQQTIRDTLGLSCNIDPALSLYVHVGNMSNQETSIEPFSSLSFEEALSVIAEKNFSAIPPEEILDVINEIINQASALFIHNALLSHPLLVKIFRQFAETFHEQLTIVLRDSIKIFMEHKYLQKKDKIENNNRPGMYL